MDDRQFTQRALDCQRKLYRVALSMLRCDADAADAIQEAVFKGWLHRGALRDGERLAGNMLIGIAHLHARFALRTIRPRGFADKHHLARRFIKPSLLVNNQMLEHMGN